MNLKDRVYKLLLENPRSCKDLAQEIGINEVVLGNVIKDKDHKIKLKNRLKIEAWLQKKETSVE